MDELSKSVLRKLNENFDERNARGEGEGLRRRYGDNFRASPEDSV
jgi:hypothetical protein